MVRVENKYSLASYVLPSVQAKLNTYQRIADCMQGQDVVKSRRTRYLPKPNPSDQSEENEIRYDQYLERAVFWGFVLRTYVGLAGMLFLRKPAISLDSGLEYLETNADGSGSTLLQVSQKIAEYVIPYGRVGILADMPSTSGYVPNEQIQNGENQPRLSIYQPASIINHRVENGKLSLVVLKETYPIADNGYQIESGDLYRELRLVDGEVVVRVYGQGEPYGQEFALIDGNGKPMTEIPFTFVGSTNNDPDVDVPPFTALADLNIAHYRNSADFEESCYITGQPMLTMSGLTKEWIADTWGGKPVLLGSRAAVPLPEGGRADMLQADPNTQPAEAMKTKAENMAQIGAGFLSTSNVERTRKEVELAYNAETAQLSQISLNISEGLSDAIRHVGLFLSGTPGGVIIINHNFESTSLTSEEQRVLLETYIKGGITWEEYRTKMLEAGIATEADHQVARDQVEDDMPTNLEGDNGNI